MNVAATTARSSAPTGAWKPRNWVRHRADAKDDATARALQKFVHELPARLAAAGVAKPRLISGSVVNAAQSSPLPETTSGWRFRFEGYDLWCVAADEAQRNILHCVLQSPASAELTALERGIVAEWLKRLLASASPAGDATQQAMYPGGPAWRCDVDVLQTSCQTFRLHFLTAASVPQPADRDAKVRLDFVSIRMTALIPLGSVALNDIVSWSPGTRIPLRGVAMPLTAGLFIGGRRIAAVEIGSIAGERVLRLARMAPALPASVS